MDRAPIDVLNATTKACADCAHRVDNTCGRKPVINKVTGATTFQFCFIERAAYGKEDCGEKAQFFVPTDDAKASRSVRKLYLGRAIEEAIKELRPDPSTALEIVAALQNSMRSRYDERIPDVMEAFGDLSVALNEADGVSDE